MGKEGIGCHDEKGIGRPKADYSGAEKAEEFHWNQQDEEIKKLKQAVRELLEEVKKRADAPSWWRDESVYKTVKKYEQFLFLR